MDGILLINKPQNMTSFDVVAKVRRTLNAKVGHAGTLDPMASGVLVLALNKATKALNYLGLEDKTYLATLTLGKTYHTGDIWGEIIEEKEVMNFDEDTLRSVLDSFKGKSEQRVPKVSAKKIDGKRSYDYVFENKEVKQLYTEIYIDKIDLISFDENTITFTASVSNGTYIRTLCEDIAEKLDNIGAMSALERTSVGPYTLEDCITLEALDHSSKIIATKDAIRVPTIQDIELEEKVMNGKRIQLESEFDQIFIDAGSYYAIYEREQDTQFKSVRGLW